MRPRGFVQESHRHLARGRSLMPSRTAGGMLLPGVILKVYRPDDRLEREDLDESLNPTVTCRVLIYAPRKRAVIDNVPILSHLLGVNDAEVWIPREAKLDLSGRSLTVEGGGSEKPTPPAQMDGDHVVVGFLCDDLNQPIIVGRLPHPKTRRRPTSSGSPLYQLERWVRSIHMGVTEAGDILVDTTKASDGTVDNQGAEQASSTSGNVTLALKQTAKLRIEIDGSNTVIEVDQGSVKIKADAVEMNSPAPGDGVARIGDKIQLHSHTMSHALTVTIGPTTYTVAGSITASSEEPPIAEGSGTVRVGD